MRALNEIVVRLDGLGKYHIMECAGEGGQGKVFLVHKKSEDKEDKEVVPFALKVIKKKTLAKKSEFELSQMVREIQVQRMLKHCSNTIKLYKIYETQVYVKMLMEYQEGGTLSD